MAKEKLVGVEGARHKTTGGTRSEPGTLRVKRNVTTVVAVLTQLESEQRIALDEGKTRIFLFNSCFLSNAKLKLLNLFFLPPPSSFYRNDRDNLNDPFS